MPCEVNAIDSAVLSAALPGPNDMVWFTRPDGTTVFIKWATLMTAMSPDDTEYEVGVTAGAPAAGAFTWTNAAWIGKRIRLYRSGTLQARIASAAMRYSFDPLTGQIVSTVAFDAGEILTIQQY
jgi:hypothetical protein